MSVNPKCKYPAVSKCLHANTIPVDKFPLHSKYLEPLPELLADPGGWLLLLWRWCPVPGVVTPVPSGRSAGRGVAGWGAARWRVTARGVTWGLTITWGGQKFYLCHKMHKSGHFTSNSCRFLSCKLWSRIEAVCSLSAGEATRMRLTAEGVTWRLPITWDEIWNYGYKNKPFLMRLFLK